MGMIKVLDHIIACYSNSDGEVIQKLIKQKMTDEVITISFSGVNSISSSFVNTAFIDLLDTYSFDDIRNKLKFIDSSRSINSIIKRRFDFEVDRRKNLINA